MNDGRGMERGKEEVLGLWITDPTLMAGCCCCGLPLCSAFAWRCPSGCLCCSTMAAVASGWLDRWCSASAMGGTAMVDADAGGGLPAVPMAAGLPGAEGSRK